MKKVFADTNYWIALINPRDDLRDRAKAATAHGAVRIVTTDWVLVEVLNFFADKGAVVRLTAARICDSIRNNPNVEVLPALRGDLEAATNIYRQYADKEWSVVDCHSFRIMRECGISEAFTHDHHFEQMGFKALLR